MNVASGEAPTSQTVLTDASGLAAGAGLAGSGVGGAAGAEAGGVPTVGAAGADVSVDPALQATFGSPAAQTGIWAPNLTFMPSGGGLPTGLQGGGVQGTGSATEGGAAAPAAAPKPPVGPAGAGPGAGGGTAPAVVGPQGAADHGGMIDQILKGMKNNAALAQLGLSGVGLAMAGGKKPIPNGQQLNELAATGSQAAKDLINSYRTGQLSAAQQAGLDQLTQQTKNQINQYFASIGQSDSTAHMQALAQVDQQALGMKQQMLDNMLQQGLSAIGVASGPLQTVANYQIAQDQNLTNAFGNFANAVGSAFGKQAGTTETKPNVAGSTPSTGIAVKGGVNPNQPSSARG